MEFHKIDLGAWERAQTYRHFRDETPCAYSICVNLNIGGLLPRLRASGVRLFPAVLYGLARGVNRHTEFRMALNERGEPGYYGISHPCYTVFHQNTQGFTDVWTEYHDSFSLFYQRYLEDRRQYAPLSKESKPLAGNNIFNVSCIPWVSFTGFHLNLKNGYDYLAPIFTIGKYFEEGGTVKLPVSLQIHHAVCDGYHAARFLNELQDWMDEF